MNKIAFYKMPYSFIVLVLVLGMSSFSTIHANVDDNTIENRIMSLGSSVDVKYSSEVRRRVKQYTISQRKTSEILLGRVSVYFPTFENIFREKGIPTDLKYLSVIESGLRPDVTSRSGAAGLWQFMRPTGRMMGLKINRTIDERRDVEKSTYAAAEYLLKLYGQFDDWTLAIAAYNCGPGNLRKAIRKSGGKKDFWSISKYLPRETREYVPKFIAMTYVMNYYYEHDLIPDMPEKDMLYTSTAKVYEKLSFTGLSKHLEIDLDLIKTLNPSFIRGYIPQTEDGRYNLVLPTHKMGIVASNYHVRAFMPVVEEEYLEELAQQDQRSIIEISPLGQAKFRTERIGVNSPLQISSIRPHFVKYGEKDEEVDLKPEAYKINNRQMTILDIGHIVKNVKKSI